jgi:hypothetical protein
VSTQNIRCFKILCTYHYIHFFDKNPRYDWLACKKAHNNLTPNLIATMSTSIEHEDNTFKQGEHQEENIVDVYDDEEEVISNSGCGVLGRYPVLSVLIFAATGIGVGLDFLSGNLAKATTPRKRLLTG